MELGIWIWKTKGSKQLCTNLLNLLIMKGDRMINLITAELESFFNHWFLITIKQLSFEPSNDFKKHKTVNDID